MYKTLTPTPGQFCETRALSAEDLLHLEHLRYAPIIVQRRLTGLDIRVTVVGSSQFVASVKPQVPEAATDWRMDLAAKWSPYPLDPDTARKLHELLEDLGLHYGCVDLRLDEDGQPHFLEVNP